LIKDAQCKPQSLHRTINAILRTEIRKRPDKRPMRMIDESSITQLLENASAGNAGSMDRVVAMLYNDLKSRAKLHLRKQFGAAAV
jgi:hypothetical protein